ncbi:MAG: AraC family transcriptional regulator, partial [Bacteroidota bacterium]
QRLLAMLHLLDQWSGHQPMELIDKLHPDATPPHTPERIQLVQRFLLQQYHRSITLAEVAELASMNKTSFCRYFKECTRKTFSQYLNELRIDYACKLLLEGTFSVSRIGYEVGYNNVPYFLRQFKKIKGLSPKQYRNQHRGDAA